MPAYGPFVQYCISEQLKRRLSFFFKYFTLVYISIMHNGRLHSCAEKSKIRLYIFDVKYENATCS